MRALMAILGRGLRRSLAPARPRRAARQARPAVESIEARLMLDAAGYAGAHLAAAHAHAAASIAAHHRFNPLAPYRIFEGTVQTGPNAGLTFEGPLVLGYNGRIQVNGALFESNGTIITVVGTVYGGGVDLRFIVPGKHSVQSVYAAGSGQLENVRGGFPGGMTLVGSGNLDGPLQGPDRGHWFTVRPPAP